MLFNSISYLIFLPIVVFIFYLLPKNIRRYWLLIVSYYFYMSWNPKYAILIAFSSLVTFYSGLGIERYKNEKIFGFSTKKFILFTCLFINLGILIFYKYMPWILNNVGIILDKEIGFPFDILLPVGISFYTFQALSYTLDVYFEKIKPQKDVINYALYVSFFPQLVAGPIERSTNLLPQINKVKEVKFVYENIRDGLILIMYGFFLKLVIADRSAIVVNTIFDNYKSFGSIQLLLGTFLFAFQILCDFNGYSIIAKGSAKLLGINLMDNFMQPYFANNIRDFWRRWHISLSTWFSDYLYKPLGGNRKGLNRTLINTLIVFIISGLWHGASWNFVAWGLLHGLYMVCSIVINRFHKKQQNKHIILKVISTIFTFIIVDFAWIFFRSNSYKGAITFIKQIFTSKNLYISRGLGLDKTGLLILVVSIVIMFVIDYIKSKKIELLGLITQRFIVIRWTIYLGLFWIVVLFGIYGVEYDISKFIYFQF